MAEQRNITYVALLNPMYSPPAICLNFSWTFKYKNNILLQNDALLSSKLIHLKVGNTIAISIVRDIEKVWTLKQMAHLISEFWLGTLTENTLTDRWSRYDAHEHSTTTTTQ